MNATQQDATAIRGDGATGNVRETEYVVLARDPTDATRWSLWDNTIKAAHADAAIAQAIEQYGPMDADRFVAVPARSWKPRKVRTETTTRHVIE